MPSLIHSDAESWKGKAAATAAAERERRAPTFCGYYYYTIDVQKGNFHFMISIVGNGKREDVGLLEIDLHKNSITTAAVSPRAFFKKKKIEIDRTDCFNWRFKEPEIHDAHIRNYIASYSSN